MHHLLHRRRELRIVVVLLLSSIALRVSAQPTLPTTGKDPRPVARAALRPGAIKIDGRLDEAAWSTGAVISDFHQQTPDEAKAPTERTEVRILFDASAIYIGARMYDSEGSTAVRKLLVRRDQLLDDVASDKIAFVLDPYHDRQTRVWFELNPLGVKGDHLNGDASFDPVWEGASSVDSLGWTAEFRIPLSQLRFKSDSVQTWGMQIWRTLARRNESDMWAFWRNNEPGGPGYFGTLVGMVLPDQPRQLELLPYVVTKSTYALPATGDPFHNRQQTGSRVGGDVKYNITSSLSLDATVNPDFGQVEVDPAVVNLSDFETTFDEKRPFFVANSSAFSFGFFNCHFCSNTSNLNVFYSRRIGRAPQLASLVSSQASYSDIPDASPILGAAKITGRTAGGLSIAVLDALTNHVDARYTTSTNPSSPFLTREAEPLTNYFVGRLRQDFRQGDTRVGMISTLTRRSLGDSSERSRLRSSAGVLGADIQHYWNNRGYSLVGQFAVSDVAGDTAAIRRTQLTSSHYFQRPFRTETSDGLFNVQYDPTRTSLRGYGLYARLAKESGNWLLETAQNWRSPGFEVNDLGTLSRTDFKWMQASAVRVWSTPGSWYQRGVALVGGQQQFNFEGDRTDLQSELYGEVTLKNYTTVNAFVINHPSVLDPIRTRGGTVQKSAGYNFYSASLRGDGRQRVTWSINLDEGKDILDNGWNADGGVDLDIKPTESIRVSVGPSYSRSVTPAQFVSNVSDATSTAFGGLRNVFARLDQHSLSMNTRLNATFSPTLTLELFAQPFLANGHYDRLSQYVAPRSADVIEYGKSLGTLKETRNANGLLVASTIDPDGTGPASAFTIESPDFNLRSLRGTAVVRWEYRPGSTLFFVWTQERSGSAELSDFDFNRDRAALFRDRPVNVFQIKASYWLGL